MKRYLLGQLAEPDEERLEMRLLTDAAFIEEFDIVVDEIAALYITGQFQGEDKKSVEEHFLRSPERRQKVKFMEELLRQVELAKGDDAAETVNNPAPPVVVPAKPGLFESLSSWWGNQSVALRAVSTFATLVILAGVAFLLLPKSQTTYQSVELAMMTADRSAGNEIARIKLEPATDALRIKLKLPADAPSAKSYRVQVRGVKVPNQLHVEHQDSQSLTVVVPKSDLPRGRYAIELTAITANGTELPLRGSYQFVID